jgi:protein-S-isoprenylcysteine O-methyltransferase Ste14
MRPEWTVTLTLLTTILFALTFVTEKILLWGRKKKSETDWDKSSLAVFDVSGVLSVPLGIILGFTDTGSIHKNYLLVSLSGIVLMLLGTALRWAAIFTLKRYFTVNVTILENHHIVKKGLYKHLRHPSYTGLLLRYLGLGLSYANWLSLALIFLPLLFSVLYRISVEEAALLQTFGDEYEEYSRGVKRLIPRVY